MYINHANFIDSLVVNYYPENSETYNHYTIGEFPASFGDRFVKEFCGWNFDVRIRVAAGYPITMKAESGIELRFTKTCPKTNPACEIKLFRPLIWIDPIKHFNEIKEQVIKKFGRGRFSIKRIDLCVHESGFDFQEEHRKLFSGKFKQVHDYIAGNFNRNRFTGFQVGSKKAPLNMKVYNKSWEVNTRESCDPAAYYSVKSSTDVWCIEFTFLRSFFKNMSIDSLDDPDVTFKYLSSLWKYATTQFVTLKADEGGLNLSRKPIEPFWEWISEQWGGGGSMAKEKKPVQIDEEVVYDRAFNRLYRAARELNAMEYLGPKKIDVVDIVKRAISGTKMTAKKIMTEESLD